MNGNGPTCPSCTKPMTFGDARRPVVIVEGRTMHASCAPNAALRALAPFDGSASAEVERRDRITAQLSDLAKGAGR